MKFDFIRKWIFLNPNSRVLDIGAGYGCFVNELYRNGINVLGLEVSSSAIKKGKSMYGLDLPMRIEDISIAHETSEKFDIILCYGVLGWLMDKIDVCLKNINNYLAPKGKIAFSIGFSDEHEIFRDILQDEASFANCIANYFKVNNFIVDYFDLEKGDIYKKNQEKDLIVLGEKIA